MQVLFSGVVGVLVTYMRKVSRENKGSVEVCLSASVGIANDLATPCFDLSSSARAHCLHFLCTDDFHPILWATVQEKAYTFLGYWTVTLVSQHRIPLLHEQQPSNLMAKRSYRDKFCWNELLISLCQRCLRRVLCAVVRIPRAVCACAKPRHQLLRRVHRARGT